MQTTPPNDHTPGIMPLDATIARTEHSIVTLSEAHAYPHGCLLHILAGARRPAGPANHWDHPEHGLRIFASQPGHEDELLTIEVQLPGGAAATNHDGPAREGQALVCANIEGRASTDPETTQLTYRQPVWISPVPTTGKLSVTAHWPAYGIQGATTHLDCSEIALAARESRPFWPST